MALHWTISFRSLRAGDDYQVNIYDSSYSGNPIPLKGGAKPFTTSEDEDGDMFAPMITQSGYIRIVDDGKDANGNAFNWKTFVPTTDKDRPVTLVKVVGQTRTIMWQGFMQAQDFSGELYNPAQEREFPIQCCLSVMSMAKVPTNDDQPRNFAYLLKTCIESIPQHSITDIYVQGGTDARAWLMKMFDWRNLLSLDKDEVYEAKYNLREALEDMCRFWGWTARTKRTTLYLMSADDSAETSLLTLTKAQLDTLAAGTSAGSTTSFSTTTLTGDIFASTNNDDTRQRGYNKAVVKSEVNNQESVIKFAPKKVEDMMEKVRTGDPATGYAWFQHPDDEVGVGYYTTARLASFDVTTLLGSCTANAGFYRRQIYPEVETDDPQIVDEIAVWGGYNGAVRASLQTKKMMMYTGGSLKITGDIWHDAHRDDNDPTTLFMKVGIGLTKGSAKWFNLYYGVGTGIVHNWNTSFVQSLWGVKNGSIKGATIHYAADDQYVYGRIPCDGQDLYGYLFIDIIGCEDVNGWFQSFEVGNLQVEFSRNSIHIPTTLNEYRQREVYVERVTIQEYTAENNNTVNEPYNVDCIYASDNNMKYGYGLILNGTSSYMGKAPYGNTTQYPEQHLANRISAFWSHSKRKIGTELRTNAIGAISPVYKVTLDGTTMYPVAISHDWADDITQLTLIEL